MGKWFRLVKTELKRLMIRPLFGLLVLVLALFIGFPLVKEKYDLWKAPLDELSARTENAQGVSCKVPKELQVLFGLNGDGANMSLLATLTIGAVVASSFAYDRRYRFTTMVLTRGFSKGSYLLAKATAVWISSLIAMILVYAFISFALKISIPILWHPIPLQHLSKACQSIFYESLSDGKSATLGPLTSFAFHHPFWNDVLGMFYLSFGVASIMLVGLISGALLPNPFVAAATPLGLLLILEEIPWPQSWRPWRPWTQLSHAFHPIPSGFFGPFLPILYWVIVGTVAFFFSYFLFSQRDKD